MSSESYAVGHKINRLSGRDVRTSMLRGLGYVISRSYYRVNRPTLQHLPFSPFGRHYPGLTVREKLLEQRNHGS